MHRCISTVKPSKVVMEQNTVFDHVMQDEYSINYNTSYNTSQWALVWSQGISNITRGSIALRFTCHGVGLTTHFHWRLITQYSQLSIL